MFAQNSYCFYFLTYYTKYFPYDVYQLLNLQFYVEVITYFGLFYLVYKLGMIPVNQYMYIFCVAACFVLVFIDIETYELILVISVLTVRGAVSCSFLISYMLIPYYFLPVQRTTAFGLTNIVSRGITLFPSLVAEIPDPWPMTICLIVSLIGLGGSTLLIRKGLKKVD